MFINDSGDEEEEIASVSSHQNQNREEIVNVSPADEELPGIPAGFFPQQAYFYHLGVVS